MTAETALPLTLAVPIVGALLIWACRSRPNLREGVTLTTALILFALVLTILVPVIEGARPSVTLVEIYPGFDLTFTVEPLGASFAAIASFLWIITSLYSIGYMRGHHEEYQTRFYAFFALALASTMGVALAGNMLTLFIFYEALSISTYPLVTHSGTPEAKRAGRVYLGILLGTSIGLQLLAVALTYVTAGTLDFTEGGILAGQASDGLVALLMALYLFGIGKAAVMPFHRWLPAAMVAPTPVSALLHAVAVVKAGVFSVLKVVIYIFGLDLLTSTGASLWLAYVAAATIILASLVAMTKDNLKARLAYSTVSQLSYVVLGAMLATSTGVLGGAMHIAMHAFGKITLFFCAGAILVAAHKTEISEMQGLGRKMPFTFAAFFLGSLSIIGLPPMGGAWSKWELALGAAERDQAILVAVLMFSSLLNVAYLIPVAVRGFLPARGAAASADEAADSGHVAGGHSGAGPPGAGKFAFGGRWRIEEAPLFCLVPLCFTAFASLVLFFYAEHLYAFLKPIGGGG